MLISYQSNKNAAEYQYLVVHSLLDIMLYLLKTTKLSDSEIFVTNNKKAFEFDLYRGGYTRYTDARLMVNIGSMFVYIYKILLGRLSTNDFWC